MKALRLILDGVEANEIKQAHALRSIATSIGFLASGCYQEAARAAQQAMTGVALPAVENRASAQDLIRGLTAIDRSEPY